MASTTTVRPSASVTASAHQQGIVLFQRSDGRIFTANQTGADVWRGIERGLSLDAIVADVSARTGVESTEVMTHAIRFVAELAQHGLVEGNLP